MKPTRTPFHVLGACWCVYGILRSVRMIPGARLGEQIEQVRSHCTGHPWNWGGFLAALAGHALALAGVAAAAWLCWRVGASLLAWVGLRRTGMAGGALALAFGLGTVSLALQGLGLAGLWFPVIFLAMALLPTWAAGGAWLPKRPLPACESRILFYLIVVGLVAGFAGTRAPQVATAVDAMTYHFAAPEHFLSLHKIVGTPWQPQWHLPLLSEMLYGPAFEAAGTEGAKSVDFLMLLACLGLLFWLCDALGRAAAGWWAAALFVGLGQVCSSLWQGKNDLGGTVFVLATAGCLLRAARGGGAAYWLAAGICGGWAYAGKPIHFLPVAAGMAGATLFFSPATAGRGMLRALSGWALVAGGWAAQNILFTGDPIYPRGFGLVRADAPWWLLNTAEAMRVKLSVPHLLPAAWPEVAAELGQTPWLPVGSLALGCLVPWALAGFERDRAGTWLKAVILGSAALTLAAAGTPRYLLPQAGLLCGLGALWLHSAGIPAAFRSALVGSSLLATLAVICAGIGPAGLAALRLAGQISREEFQLKTLTSLELMKRPLGRCVPAGRQALFIGETRRLEMPRRVMAPSTFAVSPAWKLSRESFSAAEIRKKFRQLNVSCFVYNCVSATYHAERKYPGPVWSDRQLKVYREFFASYAELAAPPVLIDRMNGGFYVWSLAGRPHAPDRLLPALPGSEGELARAIVLIDGRIDSGRSDLTMARLMQLGGQFDGIGSYHALTGFLARLMGDLEMATRELEKSMASGYLSENNLVELVGLYMQGMQLERAAELLEQAVALYPEDILRNIRAAYHMDRAYLAGINKRRMEAVRELDLALACEPTTVELLVGLAEAYRRLGMLFQARSIIRRAIELDSRHAQAAILLKRIDADIGRLNLPAAGGPARPR